MTHSTARRKSLTIALSHRIQHRSARIWFNRDHSATLEAGN